MKIIKSSVEIESIKFSNPFAFIPTMGNLHQGHLSLVEHAKNNYSETIVSIFINPLQFGKNEDFSSYPKTLTKDVRLLENIGCDYLFIPEENFAENLEVIEPKFANVLCGASRPYIFKAFYIVNKFLSYRTRCLFIWPKRLSATTNY